MTYVYTGEDHNLTAEKAFVCLTLFDIIKIPLGMLPLTVAQVTQVILGQYESYHGIAIAEAIVACNKARAEEVNVYMP